MTSANMQWRLAKVCRAVKNMAPFDERDHKAMQKRLMLNDAGEAVAVVVTVARESYTKNDGSTGVKAKITDFKPYGGTWGDDFDDLIESGEKKAKEAADKAAGKRQGSGGSGGATRPARQADDTGIPFDGGVDDESIPF
jgi:single-stranded DNA-binding protein